jgi:hypothetical protein
MPNEIPNIYNAKQIELAMADPHSMGVQKALMEVYPALAKKIFEGNALIEKLVMSGYNMMDILEYPICNKCEGLALYNGYGKIGDRFYARCTCIRDGCHSSTINPSTLRQWLQNELRHKMPQEEIDNLNFKVDKIAESMLRKYKNECRQEYLKHNAIAREQMKAKQVNISNDVDNVEVKHGSIADLPEDTIFIEDDAQEE